MAQLEDELRALWVEMRPRLRRAAVHALMVLRAVWSSVRGPLLFVLQVLAALILLFEEWGWRPLVDALAKLSRFRPIQRLELFIAGLPPYGALAALALPSSLLFPLKFLALYLMANGAYAVAVAIFVFAKVASTALIARLFLLTRPALMQIGWFAKIYNIVIPWKDRMFENIRESFAWRYGRMVKNRVRLETKQAWARAKPVLAKSWQDWRPRAAALVARAKEQARRFLVKVRQ